MSDSDKHIPTLDEMIFPGRPDKAKTTPPESAKAAEEKKTGAESTPPEAPPSRRPKRTSFETMLNPQIDAILARHMKAARAEIVRAVMLELRSRLPVANRKKK